MQSAAREMELSISSVSHHVARLEAELGAILLDRSTRPFTLTREGRAALHHLSNALQHLRRAVSETSLGGVLGRRPLKIGIVEDFESNVAPDLAALLTGRMPDARLTISHVLSHEAPEMIRKGHLDLAIVADPADPAQGIQRAPLLKDPFILAVPRGLDTAAADLLAGSTTLPFLRFNSAHLIGRQIETHLSRNRIVLPERTAFDSVQSIMAVIANGDGWAIITPLGFLRARQYALQVDIDRLPLPAFARRISLLSADSFDARTTDAIAALLRQSIRRNILDPIRSTHPWLATIFGLESAEL
jgi:DNA-binding transcriptional LysR family regulator